MGQIGQDLTKIKLNKAVDTVNNLTVEYRYLEGKYNDACKIYREKKAEWKRRALETNREMEDANAVIAGLVNTLKAKEAVIEKLSVKEKASA